MNKKTLLGAVALSCAIAISPIALRAAETPRDFVGVWLSANEGDNSCKKEDWKKGEPESDALQSISLSSVQGWEHQCDIDAVRLRSKDKRTVEVDLSCGGEGEVWKTTQLWYVQDVGTRKQLITHELKRTHRGQRSKVTYSVSINLECK